MTIPKEIADLVIRLIAADEIRVCKLPSCKKVFLRYMRGEYCSLQHSQINRNLKKREELLRLRKLERHKTR